MTSDKARKTAVRQRMAHTGEPQNVARRAVGDVPDQAEPAGATLNETHANESHLDGTRPDESPEVRYAREAAEAGVPADQVEADLAAFRLREAADRARARADRAESTASLKEEYAEAAEDTADEAEDWADDRELERLRHRADEVRAAADAARELADEAEEKAVALEERADLAEHAAYHESAHPHAADHPAHWQIIRDGEPGVLVNPALSW